ncbi:keratinocyte proline-rich protein-like [Manis pentadactyla]|uniref:keratinocyte proline-rich protein-like n=1 Tax=Manis pentadactyla TaxID=143292 RepID=UPI00255CCF9A|nr:keratinocyte proline-rich protein-like [Manis pentadactyla]
MVRGQWGPRRDPQETRCLLLKDRLPPVLFHPPTVLSSRSSLSLDGSSGDAPAPSSVPSTCPHPTPRLQSLLLPATSTGKSGRRFPQPEPMFPTPCAVPTPILVKSPCKTMQNHAKHLAPSLWVRGACLPASLSHAILLHGVPMTCPLPSPGPCRRPQTPPLTGGAGGSLLPPRFHGPTLCPQSNSRGSSKNEAQPYSGPPRFSSHSE